MALREGFAKETHLDADGVAHLEGRRRTVRDRDDVAGSSPDDEEVGSGFANPSSVAEAHPSWPPTSGCFGGIGQSPFLRSQYRQTRYEGVDRA